MTNWHSHFRRTDCDNDCHPDTYEDFAYDRKTARPDRDESKEPLWVQGMETLSGLNADLQVENERLREVLRRIVNSSEWDWHIDVAREALGDDELYSCPTGECVGFDYAEDAEGDEIKVSCEHRMAAAVKELKAAADDLTTDCDGTGHVTGDCGGCPACEVTT